MESGVPQGFGLGPSLFLMYINDLSTNLVATARLFADDSSVMCHQTVHASADQESLQSDLDKIAEWEGK